MQFENYATDGRMIAIRRGEDSANAEARRGNGLARVPEWPAAALVRGLAAKYEGSTRGASGPCTALPLCSAYLLQREHTTGAHAGDLAGTTSGRQTARIGTLIRLQRPK